MEVNEGHSLGGSDIGCPFGLRLTDNLACLLITGITGSEGHEDGVGTFGPYVVDIITQVMPVTIDGVLALGALVEADVAGVEVNAGDDGTGPSLVEEFAAVVVANGDDDPVAGLQGITDSRP